MKCILFSITFILASNLIMASHLIGGEITWQCNGAGQYIFQMKVYRDCNGISGPNTAMINTTVPGVPSINLTLISQSDISNTGSNSSGNISCATCAGGGVGAVEEFVLQSAPVTLPGVPPLAGWIFNFSSCCRNSGIINLSNPFSYSLELRAKMYSYSGSVAGQCTDASPLFAEKPWLLQCNGYDVNFNNCAIDPENDSLDYRWDYAWDGSGNNIPFAPGYSVNSPLPSATQNPANIAVTLDMHSGDLNYKSFTSGIFVTVIKASSYKCGSLTAEVFREIEFTLVNGCNIPSTVPAFNSPPLTAVQTAAGNPVKDTTICAGDIIAFNIFMTEGDADSSGNAQWAILGAAGSQFGTGFTSTAGCPDTPCAVLYLPPPVSAPIYSADSLLWITSINHLGSFYGCAYLPYTYYFYFRLKDNYCPANGWIYKTVAITVVPCNTGMEGKNERFNQFSIFPNPANEYIIISSEFIVKQKVEIIITGVLGKEVYKNILPALNSKLQTKIDLKNFSQGVYFVKLSIDGKKEVRKVVKY